ncbi:unnamed protein product [Coregonus sp. 'balchen']|nr:unnamed protein product [Coregonus sp. 'balchen']
MKDTEFTTSNNVFLDNIKQLRRQGKYITNSHPPITDKDMAQLQNSQALNPGTRRGLVQNVYIWDKRKRGEQTTKAQLIPFKNRREQSKLRRQGKYITNSHPPITDKDMAQLQNSQALNPGTRRGLVQNVWFDLQLHLGQEEKRGTDN